VKCVGASHPRDCVGESEENCTECAILGVCAQKSRDISEFFTIAKVDFPFPEVILPWEKEREEKEIK